MVAAGQKGCAAFTGVVGLGLGDFACDEGLCACFNGGFKVALCAAAAPCQTGDGGVCGQAVNEGDGALQGGLHVGGECAGAGKGSGGRVVRGLTDKEQVLFAQLLLHFKPEQAGELGVVA